MRLFALLCFAIALTACGDKDQEQAAGTRPLAGQDRQVVNQPFVVAIPQVGEIFDIATVLPAEISAVAYNINDWLFDRDHDGNIVPGLARAWEFNEDATVLDVSLREDVVFHTGTPMTAEDVVFSWERLKLGCCSSRVTRAMDSIEALDTHKVRFHFKRPEIGFVPVGGYAILSKDYFDSVGEKQFREKPVGTGPYQVKELVRGQYIDLVRNDNYWGELPEIPAARFRFVTEDTTRVAQLQTGEADFVMMVPYPLVSQVEARPELKTALLSPGGMSVFLALKTDNPETPWAKAEVRRAIALAIDRKAIVNDILLGYPQHFPFLAPGDNGYDPDLKPYPHDPEAAKKLLAQAGETGLEFELRYITGGITGQKETAAAVALYLNEVGIKARAVPIEGPQFIQWVVKASRNPEQDYVSLFIGGIPGRAESANGINAQFSSRTPFAWYVNPEINEMVHDMASTADAQTRAEKIREIGRAMHADMRYIPLWTSTHVYGMKQCIDFEPTLGEYDLVLLRDISIARCQLDREVN